MTEETNREIAAWMSKLSKGSFLELTRHGLEDVSETFETYALRVGPGDISPLPQISWVREQRSPLGTILVVVESPASRATNTLLEIQHELESHWPVVQSVFFGDSFCFAAGMELEKPSSSFSSRLEDFYRSRVHTSQQNEKALKARLALTKRDNRRISEVLKQTKEDLLNIEADALNLQTQLSGIEREANSVRKTLSFQLGYELIHGFKSVNRLTNLPATLWSLRNEARKRKQSKESKLRSDKRRKSNEPFAEESPKQREAAPKMKVACIFDDFTFAAFAPECELFALSPDTWQATIDRHSPDILFVESAWHGQNDEWSRKIAPPSVELESIIAYCQGKEIPTVFWAKEDPVDFSHFAHTASCFDFVFTTDIDCIARYKQQLGHKQVYLLPFACQPSLHNPTEVYERKPGACFAGAYYAEFPERQVDFYRIVKTLTSYGDVDIFDRNFDLIENSRFPQYYHSLIQGKLDYSEIDLAYKGYRTAININSVKQSQTMFARRTFELLASNTLVVSNFSQGMSDLLGNLAMATDSVETIEKWIQRLQNDQTCRKYRLLGLRKVLSEHTYEHRFSYVLSKALSWENTVLEPKIAVMATAESEEEFSRIYEMFALQKYKNKHLFVIGQTSYAVTKSLTNYTLVDEKTDLAKSAAPYIAAHDFVAYFHPDDGYGPNYLFDLALATKYTRCSCIGKKAVYRLDTVKGLQLRNDGSQYQECESLGFRASMVKTDYCAQWKIEDFKDGNSWIESSCYSIDEFNYCLEGSLASDSQRKDYNGDLDDIQGGLSMLNLLNLSEQIGPCKDVESTVLPDYVVRRFDTLTVVNGEPGCERTFLDTDLYCVSERDFAFGEIGGIKAMFGSATDLQRVAASGYSQIELRQVDEKIWEAIAPMLGQTKIIVSFSDFSWNDKEPGPTWVKEVLSSNEEKLELRFSSKYLLETILEQFLVKRGSQNFQIAYPKLEECFSYTKKDESYRKLVLVNISDTPLEVWTPLLNSILSLSERRVFSQFQFHIVCDKNNSSYAKDTLSEFQNVTIEIGDLTPSDRAELYGQNGVLLSSDTTCRDITLLREALVSGLVPIVFDHGQAAEFVTTSVGEVVSGTDPQAMADTLEDFASDPARFLDRVQNTFDASNR